jgi:hypothetical protein
MPIAGTINESLTKNNGECGRLSYVSTTALSFKPFEGNAIKINGAVYEIPSSGMVGLANTGVFINGVAGQNLAVNTRYYVYAFINAGVLTADFSTTGHSTSVASGNSGTEIKTGDETRSLVGMVMTNASSQFTNTLVSRLVVSWFNRVNLSVQGAHTNNFQASALTPYIVTMGAAEFCVWGDDGVMLGISGWMANNAGYYSRASLGVDGSTSFIPTASALEELGYNRDSPPYWITPCLYACRYFTEGYHYIVPLVWVGGGLGTFTLFGVATIRG